MCSVPSRLLRAEGLEDGRGGADVDDLVDGCGGTLVGYRELRSPIGGRGTVNLASVLELVRRGSPVCRVPGHTFVTPHGWG